MRRARVKFYIAKWCDASIRMIPIIKEECKLLNLGCEIVDVDENVDETIEYGIKNVPYTLVFRGNKIIDKHKGNDACEFLKKYS